MQTLKLPISASTGSRTGLRNGADVKPDASVSDDPPFDFRSPRFCADAISLVRLTGRSLVDCREFLFISEGDMALALDWLKSGYGAPSDEPLLH